MKKFSITITETCSATFCVEAHSKEEAEKLFQEYYECGVPAIDRWINDCIEDGYDGREISEADEDPDDAIPDITYAELKGGNENE